MNYLPDDIVQRCCFCDRLFRGPGNNPAPVRKKGRCCNECYSVRVGMLSSKERFNPMYWYSEVANSMLKDDISRIDVLGDLRPINRYLAGLSIPENPADIPVPTAKWSELEFFIRRPDLDTPIHEAAHAILDWHRRVIVSGIEVDEEGGTSFAESKPLLQSLLAGPVVDVVTASLEDDIGKEVNQMFQKELWNNLANTPGSKPETTLANHMRLYHRSACRVKSGGNPWMKPNAVYAKYKEEWDNHPEASINPFIYSTSVFRGSDEYKYLSQAMPCEENEFLELVREDFRAVCGVMARHLGTLKVLIGGFAHKMVDVLRLFPSDVLWIKKKVFDAELIWEFRNRPTTEPPRSIERLRLPLEKIVSGAQTGVERAALDAAHARNLATGGWVPKGRVAEDGEIPCWFRELREMDSSNELERTELNVRDSDATLVLSFDWKSMNAGVTKQAMALAKKYGKPLWTIVIDKSDPHGGINRNHLMLARRFIRKNNVRVLNVTGPRESGQPGVQEAAKKFLGAVIDEVRLT